MVAVSSRMGVIFTVGQRIYNISPTGAIYELIPSSSLFQELQSFSGKEGSTGKIQKVDGIDIGPIKNNELPIVPDTFPEIEFKFKPVKIYPFDSDTRVAFTKVFHRLKIVAFPFKDNYYVAILPADNLPPSIIPPTISLYRKEFIRAILETVVSSIELSEKRRITADEIQIVLNRVTRTVSKIKSPTLEIEWQRIFFNPATGIIYGNINYTASQIMDYISMLD